MEASLPESPRARLMPEGVATQKEMKNGESWKPAYFNLGAPWNALVGIGQGLKSLQRTYSGTWKWMVRQNGTHRQHQMTSAPP